MAVNKFQSKSIQPARAALTTAAASVLYGVALILLDLAIANRYGTSTYAAAFHAANIVPALLANILSGGAVIGSFVPVFVSLGGPQGTPESQRFVGVAATLIGVTLVIVCAALAVMSPLLLALVASGLGESERGLAEALFLLILPMLVFHGVGSVFAASLLSLGQFGTPNLSPALVPLCALISHALLGETLGVQSLAFGLTLGAVLQAGLLYFWLRREGIQLRATLKDATRHGGAFLRTYFHTALASAALSAIFLVNQAIAGSLSPRHLAAFAYGTKLVALFLAFCTTVAANTALPHFASVVAKKQIGLVWNVARAWSVRAFLVLTPLTLVWAFGAEWIVRVIYERGAFAAEDVTLVAGVQRWFVLQAPFYVVGAICWRMHNALGNSVLLMTVSGLVLILDIGVAMLLSDLAGIEGVAIAQTITIALWAAIMLLALRKHA